jgi:two-component system LytT family response regulator
MSNHNISLIIDNNPEAASRLRSALATSYPAFSVVAVGTTVSEGIDLVMKFHPAVLFLDVELPDGTGFDLLDVVRGHVHWQMRVVFYTAYEKCWLQAIRAKVFDFIRKPFTDEELAVVIKHLQKEPPPPTVVQYIPYRECFCITTLTGSRVFRASSIGYFMYEADTRQWKVQLTTPENPYQSLYLRKQTDATQILLASEHFMQVNKSTIINIDYLCHIEENWLELMPPFNDCRIKLSRKYKKAVAEVIMWL